MKPPLEGKPGAEGTPDAPKSGKPAPGDRVDISKASKHLRADPDEQAKRTDMPRPEGTLSEKQATVQERIASGFYNREEVISHIARRILDLLGFK